MSEYNYEFEPLNELFRETNEIANLWKTSDDAVRAIVPLSKAYSKYIITLNNHYTEKFENRDATLQRLVKFVEDVAHKQAIISADYVAKTELIYSVIKQLRSGDGVLDLLKEINTEKNVKRILRELAIASAPI